MLLVRAAGGAQLLHALPGHEMPRWGMALFRAAALHLGTSSSMCCQGNCCIKHAQPSIQACKRACFF